MYIVGLVYRKGRQHFLAVERETLVTEQGGRLVELKPGVKLTIAREVSVGDLCRRWGVEMEQIDRVSEKWLAPSEAGRLRGNLQKSAYLGEWTRKWEQRPRERMLVERGAGSRRRRNRQGNVRRGRFVRR